jgi:hypothetical protein
MVRLFKKIGKFADSIVDKVKDEAMEALGDVTEKFDVWIDIGKESRSLSQETSQICKDTSSQREMMISFASEIQSTLENGFSGEKRSSEGGQNPADILNTIKDLTDGDKVKAAMEIATGLRDIAEKCCDKSLQLTTLIDRGLEALPDFIQNAITKGDGDDEVPGSRGLDDEDDDDDDDIDVAQLIKGVETDIQDVTTCIDEIQHFKLANALKVGMSAFVHLNEKAVKSRSLFDEIQKYADDVNDITHAFDKDTLLSGDVINKVRDVAKALLRSSRCTEVMKLAAEMAGKLLNIIVNLFDAVSNQISKLWSALAFAKDCMVDCIQCITSAKAVCTKAKTTSTDLVTSSRSVGTQLRSATKMDFSAIKSLVQDGGIEKTITLARTIDDDVIECAKQVVAMIKKVNDGFKNLPEMITSDLQEQQSSERGIGDDDNTDQPNVDDDVNDMDNQHQELEKADFFSATTTGEKGFSSIADRTEKCIAMITSLEDYATDSSRSIDSFLDVWDLESITTKLLDMMKIVKLGNFMEHITQQITKLVQKMIDFMKTALDKFSKIPDAIDNIIPDEKIAEAIQHGADKVEDAIDNLKDKFKFSFGR